MKRALTLIVSIAMIVLAGCVIFPNGIHTGKKRPQPKLVPPPTFKRAALAVKPPRRFHLTVVWSNQTAGASYQLFKGTNGQIYTNGLVANTTNRWLTVSNLIPGVDYIFVVATVDTNGQSSNYSMPCYWPQPLTNYIALGDSTSLTNKNWVTNAVLASTNDKGFYRGRRIGGLYEVLFSSDLKMWTPPITNWPATNVVLNSYLRSSRWSNWDYAHPD